jgi:hypothetical protein
VIVAHVDGATADEALAGDAQVRRHRHHGVAEPAQAALGRRDQLASANSPRRWAMIPARPVLTVPKAFTQSASSE